VDTYYRYSLKCKAQFTDQEPPDRPPSDLPPTMRKLRPIKGGKR
jgi:hypothetical protein